jgi:PAS domain S-box-containing protein
MQDQIFVLDREQRMVAFFGHWPKQAPWRLEELLGKRKRDVFGPRTAALHENASARALKGEELTYEWSLTDSAGPVHLYTTASPLRDDEGKVAGILLVTRNITQLKHAQQEIEAALREKTAYVREVESAVQQIVAASQRTTTQGRVPTTRPDPGYGLSPRECEVLDLLRQGVRLRTIAQRLGISVETARRHVKAMFRKTGVHSQESLVRVIFDNGESSRDL